jgi:hypothetical protein
MEAFDWLVGNGKEPAVSQVEALGLFVIERASATAPEDGQLVSRFVNGSVAIDAF